MTHKLLITLVLFSLTLNSAEALIIRSYDAQRHDRFTNFPTAPIFNTNFMHAGLNLTGVAWEAADTNHQLTMISPLHFVGAAHVSSQHVGSAIKFLATDGSVKEFTIASKTPIKNDDGTTSDLYLGTLNRAILPNEGIVFFPYHNLNRESNYNGLTTVFLGKRTRGAKGKINRIINANDTRCIEMLYLISNGDADDAHLESGDSGSPVFIDQNGVATIVAVNYAVGSDSTYYASYSSFIPNYANKLNTAMESQGYHMTKSYPGSTTISLSHQITTTPIRAGHPVDIAFTLTNTGSKTADNIQLVDTPNLGVSAGTSSGTAWFDESSNTIAQARKANLNSGESSVCHLSLIPSSPGTVQHQVTYSSDQYTSGTTSLNFEVIESFLSWGDSLTNKDEDGDDDSDGIVNLLEYAFGGDPTSAVRILPGTSIPLLPTYNISESSLDYSFIRRTDYEERAITYAITSSTNLDAASWSDASPLVTQTTVTPINTEFEKITLTLTIPDGNIFFQLDVSLNE